MEAANPPEAEVAALRKKASRVQSIHGIDRRTLGKALFHNRAKINLAESTAGIAAYLKNPCSKLDGPHPESGKLRWTEVFCSQLRAASYSDHHLFCAHSQKFCMALSSAISLMNTL
jgi:hypothetical protein